MSRPVNAFARMDEPIHPHGGHAAGGRAKPVTPGAAAVCGVGAELADRALVVTMPADEPRGLGVVRGMEQLDFNLLFRWFVGLAMDDPI